jgi:Dullard-like phosphatase family protein
MKRRQNRSFSHGIIPRPVLVLDLDETLVHATLTTPSSGAYFQVRVRRRHLFVQIRPGLTDFLARVQRIYDVFFFTGSLPDYGNAIIEKVAPDVHNCRRFFRDSCQAVCGYLVKDLSVLRLPLARTLLVDDIAGSALANRGNLVLIKPWMGDQNDRVLTESLLPLLEQVVLCSDLAAVARETLMKGKSPGLAAFPVTSV